jgi:predicted dehydrogenase
MRLGIAGCGRIAQRGYLPAVLAAEGMTIAGFADPDADRLQQCGELWERGAGSEALTFPTVAELLRTPVDLLVITAPVAHHLALAEEVAAAGVRCLVEKPPAPDLAAAEQLAALEPLPFVAFNRRFLQGVELRDEIPVEGWLEFNLELRFHRDAWGAHQARDEALLDAGIHLIDLACHLSGATPIAVRRARIEPERADLELELSRGRARISCATDRSHREAISVRNRSGKLLARSSWGGIHARLSPLFGRPDPLVLSLRRQLEAIEATGASLLEPPHPLLQQGRPSRLPVATAHDGIVAMAIVEAARRSADLGGAEVTVAPLRASA